MSAIGTKRSSILAAEDVGLELHTGRGPAAPRGPLMTQSSRQRSRSAGRTGPQTVDIGLQSLGRHAVPLD